MRQEWSRAPNTPQQNGVVERKFATLFGRSRAMLNQAGFNEELRHGLWAEAANLATLLDSITVKAGEEKCAYEKFFGKLPKWVRYLRTFGEVGIIKDNEKMQGKLNNKGREAVFVGYPNESHAGNVYRFYMTEKKSIALSRDVLWTGKFWYDYTNPSSGKDLFIEDMIVDANEDIPEEAEEDTTVSGSGRASESGRASYRLQRELKRLDAYYNPTMENEMTENVGLTYELANLAVLTGAMDPTSFQDAYYAKNPVDQKGWREGIKKEFNDMKKRSVWKVRKKSTLPADVRLLGSKWVFKKKNGIYGARLVAKGYDQVPGVNFTENFAPVINDVSIRAVLVLLQLQRDWIATIVDVETAFLYGDMDVELYIEVPEGMEFFEHVDSKKDCLLLEKTIYGTVQAARQWWKKFIQKLEEELQFARSKVDACLLYKKDDKGTVILCIYVDDACIFGNVEAVQKAKKDISDLFKVKDVGDLIEYVGVTVEKRNGHILLSQPDIISRLERYFGKDVEHLKEYKTPFPAHYHVSRPEEGDTLLGKQDMLKY